MQEDMNSFEESQTRTDATSLIIGLDPDGLSEEERLETLSKLHGFAVKTKTQLPTKGGIDVFIMTGEAVTPEGPIVSVVVLAMSLGAGPLVPALQVGFGSPEVYETFMLDLARTGDHVWPDYNGKVQS